MEDSKRPGPHSSPSVAVRGSVSGSVIIAGEGNRVQMISELAPAAPFAAPPPLPGAESALTRSRAVPTPALLRQTLAGLRLADSDLDALCIDYFPEVYRRFSVGQDAIAKHNILLWHADPAELARRLRERFPHAERLLSAATAPD